MKRLRGRTLQSLLLTLEAALIIAGLVMGNDVKVGMGCYWAMIAFNHLTEFIIGLVTDGGQDDEGRKSD